MTFFFLLIRGFRGDETLASLYLHQLYLAAVSYQTDIGASLPSFSTLYAVIKILGELGQRVNIPSEYYSLVKIINYMKHKKNDI